MWIQVRSFDGKNSLQVDNLSKLTKIEELRLRLVEKFEAPPERQRLFYSLQTNMSHDSQCFWLKIATIFG
jgi:hypothetical protein